jgi:hypothetical protein
LNDRAAGFGALDLVADTASVAGDGVDAGTHVTRARNATPTLIETIERQSEALIQKVEGRALDDRMAARGREGAQ